MENTNNKVLAFDLGNVLFGFDYRIALRRIKDRIKVSPEEILKKIYENNFGLDFEKGAISARQFYKEFKTQFAIEFDYAEFVDVWCDIFYPNREVIDLVASLEKRYRLFLISNINELHFNFLYNRYRNVFLLFEDLILSFKIKAIKPDAAIYNALRDAAGVVFDEIIYIDDRKELIDAAQKFNMCCLQFKDCQQLIKDLQAVSIQCDKSACTEIL